MTLERLSWTQPDTRLDAPHRIAHELVEASAVHPLRHPEVGGPFLNDYLDILATIDATLKQIDPRLNFDFLAAMSYESEYAQEVRRSLTEISRVKLSIVRANRCRVLTKYAKEHTVPALTPQTLPNDLLARPNYLRQGDGASTADSIQACFMACFRMILSDILGGSPLESHFIDALTKTHGQSLVHDDVYLSILASDYLRQITGKSVTIRGFTGADFDFIHQRVQLITRKIPHAKMYCIASLQSEEETETTAIWHTNILLSVSETAVTVHDPSLSRTNGSADREVPKANFIRRWSQTCNRGYLVTVV